MCPQLVCPPREVPEPWSVGAVGAHSSGCQRGSPSPSGPRGCFRRSPEPGSRPTTEAEVSVHLERFPQGPGPCAHLCCVAVTFRGALPQGPGRGPAGTRRPCRLEVASFPRTYRCSPPRPPGVRADPTVQVMQRSLREDEQQGAPPNKPSARGEGGQRVLEPAPQCSGSPVSPNHSLPRGRCPADATAGEWGAPVTPLG